MRIRGKKIIFNRKDCWNLDNVLAPIILAGLKKFKEELVRLEEEDVWGRGYPSNIVDDGLDGNNIQSLNNDLSEDDIGYELWKEAIDKMIYAFGAEEPEPEFDFIKGEHHDEEVAGGFKRYDMRPDNEEKYQKWLVQNEEHGKKVKEGLALFSKHFHDLWW